MLTTTGKWPHVTLKHTRGPEDLRKRTRQSAKCVFAVSRGSLELLLQLCSLGFARMSTGSCEAGADFEAGSEASRSAAGPGSVVSSMVRAESR